MPTFAVRRVRGPAWNAAVAMREEGWLSSRPRVLAKPFHLRHLIDEIEALLLE